MPTPTDAPAAPGPRREAPALVLLRGLAVLEALNRRPISSLAQLAAETGLAKPTLVRVLGILALKNYAERLPNRRGYRIGGRVRALSAGYRASASVVSIARPLLARFTAQHKWPVSIGTLDGDAMRLEASTQQDTAFAAATDRGRLARRLPLLTSALGLAYLAFCPAEERATLLEMLHPPPADRSALDRVLPEIAARGYATTPPLPGEQALGFAVPIRSGHAVLGCITLRYFGKALSEHQVAARYLAPLQDMAAVIAANQRLGVAEDA